MAKEVTKKPITKEAYETALKGYVHSFNQVNTLAAAQAKELEPINKRYNDKFEKLKTEMDADFDMVQQYCEENRKALFPIAKSCEAFGAEIGFRDGAEKVIILEGFDEKKIVELMLKRKALLPYVRATYAMDKVKIKKEKPKGTEKIGFKVGSEENFFLEPVKQEVPA